MIRGTHILTAIILTGPLWACGPSSEQPPNAETDTSPAAASKAAPEPKAIPTVTKNFGEIAEVSVPIPNFSRLSHDEQVRLFQLSNAQASAQQFREARAPKIEARVRTVLSGILKAKSRVPTSIFEKVGRYAEQYRLHGGPNNGWTGSRLRPSFIPGELAAAAQAALRSGVDLGLDDYEDADLGANRLELLDRFLGSLRPVLYGTSTPASKSIKPSAKTEDAAASFSLPSSAEAAAAVSALVSVLPTDEAAPLKPLAEFLKTGDPNRYAAYIKGWIKAARPHELVAFFDRTDRSDTEENAPLPGRFQIIAAVQDSDHTPVVQRIAAKASYFERVLPGNAMFIRPLKSIIPPAAAAYRVVAAAPWSEAVDMGALSYPAPRFPQNGRESKVLLFLDAAQAREKSTGEAVVSAFSPDEQTRFLRLKWRETARTAFMVLRNVIGYQAGTRKSDGESHVMSNLKGIWEEIHADLVALHFSTDPEVAASGLIPEPECARALLLTYISGLLEQAAEAREEGTLKDRRAVARRVIVRGLLKSGAVSVESVNGHFQVLLRDEEAAQKNIEKQLSEAARILALGALGDAQSLVDTDGEPLPKNWRSDAAQRLFAAGVAPKTAYLFSRISAVKGDSGKLESISAEPVSTLSEWIAEP